MAERFSQEEESFICPICLDLLKDPAAIPCGHNFCMRCIHSCWDQEDTKRVYSCPLCQHTFHPRPVLYKNPLIAEMVEKFRKTRIQADPPFDHYAGPGDVECDICSGRKLKAVKSCLECVHSYCESHYKAHNELNPGRNHKVVDATGQLQERICAQHGKPLEIFCCTDQSCVCFLCLVNEHKGHNTESTSAGRKEKQTQLGQTQKRFQQRVQKRERELQELRKAVETLKRSAQTAVEGSERTFTEMIRSLERRRSEVKELIRAQEKAENVVSVTSAPCSTVTTSTTFSQSFSFVAVMESVSVVKAQLEEKLDDVIMQGVVKISAADTDPELPVRRINRNVTWAPSMEMGGRCMLGKAQSVVGQQTDLQRLQRSCSLPNSASRVISEAVPIHRTLDRQLMPTDVLESSAEYGGWVEGPHVRPQLLEVSLQSGPCGFGFGICDSPLGQRVSQLLDEQSCCGLLKDDIIKEIDHRNVQMLSHAQVVGLLKKVPIGGTVTLLVLRGALAVNTVNLDVFITRDEESGFGLRICGGERPGQAVYIGTIIPYGAAERDGQLRAGDELICIDSTSITGYSHKQVVDLMTNAVRRGHVMLTIRRKI
ncbi:E3 ubiquitin/ISG15 ligase TRIM25-like isoform X2 [Sardina pilchardus]|uniref:E3 ubiquitin/ISG15 ligase TRIM25-like isoform X2 n=1 Tax=Sardina pilchardus TaxID=27697 RepID=UPI002E10720F